MHRGEATSLGCQVKLNFQFYELFMMAFKKRILIHGNILKFYQFSISVCIKGDYSKSDGHSWSIIQF